MTTGIDLDKVRRALRSAESVVVQGRIVRATGLVIEATLPRVALGTSCEIKANAGHFPAVDVLASVSRCMSDVTTMTHRELATQARDVLAAYREAADLIEVGAYQAGSNPRVDRALQCVGPLNALLRQGPGEVFDLVQTLAQLRKAVTPPETPARPPAAARREQPRG